MRWKACSWMRPSCHRRTCVCCGTPAAGYRLNVSGSYTGAFPIAGLGFASGAPGGTYNFSVQAVNACGAGPVTAFQTVVIP